VVESYLETGEPVGSRTMSRGGLQLSPASIRNTMQDLAQLGLLDAPHTSAGRMPTHAGLRMFVDGLLEVGDIGRGRAAAIESRLFARGRSFEEALAEAGADPVGPGRRGRHRGHAGPRRRGQARRVRGPGRRPGPGGHGVRRRHGRESADEARGRA
jgi:hypothetical protein